MVELTPAIVNAWEAAGRHLGARSLQVTGSQLFDSGLVRSHGDGIELLGLDIEVVHPVSLRQIRVDARSFRAPGDEWA